MCAGVFTPTKDSGASASLCHPNNEDRTQWCGNAKQAGSVDATKVRKIELRWFSERALEGGAGDGHTTRSGRGLRMVPTIFSLEKAQRSAPLEENLRFKRTPFLPILTTSSLLTRSFPHTQQQSHKQKHIIWGAYFRHSGFPTTKHTHIPTHSDNIEVTGSGVFDGQGYTWWYVLCSPATPSPSLLNNTRARYSVDGWRFLALPNGALQCGCACACMWCRWAVFLTTKDQRPNLLEMDTCTNLLIHNLRFWNSPRYHINLHNVVVRHCLPPVVIRALLPCVKDFVCSRVVCAFALCLANVPFLNPCEQDVVVRDLEIYVDVFAQREVYMAFDMLDAVSGLPIFPLNTGETSRSRACAACVFRRSKRTQPHSLVHLTDGCCPRSCATPQMVATSRARTCLFRT